MISSADVETEAPWTYDDYWATVLGPNSDAGGIVRAFDLVPSGLDEWLGYAEAEAWSADGHRGEPIPEQWAGFHARALGELSEAAEARWMPASEVQS
jgi:hypothetical protein